MKRYLFSFCCFLAIVIGGCKKSQPLLAPEPPPEKLVTIKQTINNGAPVKFFDEFVYDDEDRLKEIKANNGNGSVINRRYYYSGNQVQYKYYVNGIEQPTMSLDLTINSAGYVEESLSLQQGYRLVYEYNNMNFVKKINFLLNGVHNSYSQYYYSSNNRLDSMVYRSNDNMNSYVTTYSYMMDKKIRLVIKIKASGCLEATRKFFCKGKQCLSIPPPLPQVSG